MVGNLTYVMLPNCRGKGLLQVLQPPHLMTWSKWASITDLLITWIIWSWLQPFQIDWLHSVCPQASNAKCLNRIKTKDALSSPTKPTWLLEDSSYTLPTRYLLKVKKKHFSISVSLCIYLLLPRLSASKWKLLYFPFKDHRPRGNHHMSDGLRNSWVPPASLTYDSLS